MREPRRRVNSRELILWSFLMASAHGAGLMLAPVLAALRGEGMPSALAHAGHAGHVEHAASTASEPLASTLMAVGLHSAALLAVAGTVAVIIYQWIGVDILRRAWVNLDLVWARALAVTGVIALGIGLWPL